MSHHNKLHDEVGDLARKSFTPTHVRKNRLVHTGHYMQSVNSHVAGQMIGSYPILNNKNNYMDDSVYNGDFLIQDL